MNDVLVIENNIVNILEVDNSEHLIIEDISVELLTIGEQGPEGIPGQPGLPGQNGIDGLSAYQIALENGFVGTESDFLLSLKGEPGPQGNQGPQGLKGDQGDPATQLVFIGSTEPTAPNGLWIKTGLEPNGNGVDLILMETT